MRSLKIILLLITFNFFNRIHAQDSTDLLVGKWESSNLERDLIDVIKGKKYFLEITKKDDSFRIRSYSTIKNNTDENSKSFNSKILKIKENEYEGKFMSENNKEITYKIKLRKKGKKMKVIYYYLLFRGVIRLTKLE
jgi:hypothetical protein